MKNILLLIHDDPGQEARYQAALDITRAQNGHLTCLDVTIVPEFVGDYLGEGGVLLADEQASETANKARMLERLEREDVSFDWVDRTAFVAQAIEDHAGLTDLIVMSADDEGCFMPRMADVIGDVLVRLGKPVMVIPAKARRLDLHGQALVAWDGSEDAEAALQAATPLLGHAKTVVLYHADDGSMRLPIEDAARYLSRHGIEPVIKREPAGIDRPGTCLLSEARLGHHQWAVMGAYSRSRTVETIFGGATRAMLEKSAIPVLLAHRR